MTTQEFRDDYEEDDTYCSWCDQEIDPDEEHECFIADEWDAIDLTEKLPIKKMKDDYYD